MKHKKKLSMMLLVALLASLASCGGDAPANDTTAASGETTAASSETTAAVTEPAVPMPDIEKCDYEGETFNIYAPAWGPYPAFYHAEEQSGEAMDDALYERNRMVEEYLGIDITFTNEGR